MSSSSYRRSILPKVNEPLPRSVPSPIIQDAVNEAENNIQAPWELTLLAAIGAIAIPIQGLFDVRKPSGQIVPISLMMLSIADSGERKSTVENVFFNPIREFQKKQSESYESQLKAWKSRSKIWAEKQKVILRQIRKLAANGCDSDVEEKRLVEHEHARPVKPKQFKMIYEDTTPEALFSGLHENLPTAGLISSEGGALLNGRALGDLSKLNAIWSGDAISVDRKTSPSFELVGARLTTSVMVQSSALNEYLNRCGDKSRGSGLWARFLVCRPESTQGSRLMKNETMSWEHCNRFAARMDELLEQNVVLLEEPDRKRQTLSFTLEASRWWLNIYNDIEYQIRERGRFDKAGDHASKLADNIARVAALVHVFERSGGEIPLSALLFAVDFCLWCSDHFYNTFVPPEQWETDADLLYNWLLEKRKNKGLRWLSKTYIRQHCPNKIREINRLNEALEVLWERKKIDFDNRGRTQGISIRFAY